MDGDLGVYCQCYTQESNSKEVRSQHIVEGGLHCRFLRTVRAFSFVLPDGSLVVVTVTSHNPCALQQIPPQSSFAW